MKRALSIWLLCVVLLQSISNCVIEAAFYLNRNYIASTLCINRFDRIPVCKGSCFLERKISENEKREEHTPDLKFRDIMLFCQQHPGMPDSPPPAASLSSFPGYISPCKPRLLIRHIFKPPACSV